MFLTAVTWWEINTGYRPRDLVHREPLGQTAKQEDSGDEVEGPAHTFSFSLEKGYFFSIFFTIFMFINESCIRFPFHFSQRFRLKTEGNDQDD